MQRKLFLRRCLWFFVPLTAAAYFGYVCVVLYDPPSLRWAAIERALSLRLEGIEDRDERIIARVALCYRPADAGLFLSAFCPSELEAFLDNLPWGNSEIHNLKVEALENSCWRVLGRSCRPLDASSEIATVKIRAGDRLECDVVVPDWLLEKVLRKVDEGEPVSIRMSGSLSVLEFDVVPIKEYKWPYLKRYAKDVYARGGRLPVFELATWMEYQLQTNPLKIVK